MVDAPERTKKKVAQCSKKTWKHFLLVDVVEGDEETAVGGGGDLAAEEVLDELGALGFGVDGLGTFLEIDREKSHCVFVFLGMVVVVWVCRGAKRELVGCK